MFSAHALWRWGLWGKILMYLIWEFHRPTGSGLWLNCNDCYPMSDWQWGLNHVCDMHMTVSAHCHWHCFQKPTCDRTVTDLRLSGTWASCYFYNYTSYRIRWSVSSRPVSDSQWSWVSDTDRNLRKCQNSLTWHWCDTQTALHWVLIWLE